MCTPDIFSLNNTPVDVMNARNKTERYAKAWCHFFVIALAFAVA